MTLPASGAISLGAVNTEIGAAASTPRGLGWVRDNSFYAYKDLNSIYGCAWFQATSSKGVINRTTGATTTDCVQNCSAQLGALKWFNNCACDGDCNCSYQGECKNANCVNCVATSAVNCNQCTTAHGSAMIQKNCNCNCNCYNCDCRYSDCDCNCACSDCG